MMQFDMYHSYTVDEHTLKAIGILHDIESGVLRETVPVATEVMPEIGSRRALYVATLLHDIAKGEEVIIQSLELRWLWLFARDWV